MESLGPGFFFDRGSIFSPENVWKKMQTVFSSPGKNMYTP